VVRLPTDVGVVKRLPDAGIAFSSESRVISIPDDAVGVQPLRERGQHRLGVAASDEQVAAAVAVRLTKFGESVEQASHSHVAGVCEHVVVEDEHGRDSAAIGGGREPDVVGDAEVASVPEQLHGTPTDAKTVKPPAPGRPPPASTW